MAYSEIKFRKQTTPQGEFMLCLSVGYCEQLVDRLGLLEETGGITLVDQLDLSGFKPTKRRVVMSNGVSTSFMPCPDHPHRISDFAYLKFTKTS